MKVAYNNCYGGFSLSPLAQDLYMSKKGQKLFWYVSMDESYPLKNWQRIRDIAKYIDANKDKGMSILSSMRLTASTKDLGSHVKEIPDEHYYYKSWLHEGSEDRADPDLIAVIEELGEQASGDCAKLAIKEIPDGVDFEITEYDGLEDVLPPRMSWGLNMTKKLDHDVAQTLVNYVARDGVEKGWQWGEIRSASAIRSFLSEKKDIKNEVPFGEICDFLASGRTGKMGALCNVKLDHLRLLIKKATRG